MQANRYLSTFYLFYWVFLRQETFFRWNRMYLLAGLVMAFLLPPVNLPVLAGWNVSRMTGYLVVTDVGLPVAIGSEADASSRWGCWPPGG